MVYDRLIERLAKDMDNTNEDIDIAEFDLKDFLIKNDAKLEPGQTMESIIGKRVKPLVARRKLEAKMLVQNSIAYLEQSDIQMQDVAQNIINFFKSLATKLDQNKERLKKTQQDF